MGRKRKVGVSYYELTVLPSSLCMSVRIRTTVEQTNDVHYLLFLLKYIKSDVQLHVYMSTAERLCSAAVKRREEGEGQQRD